MGDCDDVSGFIFPLFGDDEQQWPNDLRAVLYVSGMLWCFLGVAIVCDTFMGSIEAITSKKKRVRCRHTDRYVTVRVWNDTVANLTLMALGSSAPEILLSVTELLLREFYSGDLGPSTIVGSAAFNLLMITAICVSAIPAGEVRKIKEMKVFAVTSFFSLWAYLWIIIMVEMNTRDVVEPWEGAVTLIQFPLLVFIAFCADRGLFSEPADPVAESKRLLLVELSPEELAIEMSRVRKASPKQLSDEKVLHILQMERDTNIRSRAAYRCAATRAYTGGARIKTTYEAQRDAAGRLPESDSFGFEGMSPTPPEPALQLSSGMKETVLEFAAAKYAVLESAGEVVTEVNRSGDMTSTVMVHYTTRDGTALSGSDYHQTDGDLKFLPNELTKEIRVQIIDDEDYEEDEEFYVSLFRPLCLEGNCRAVLGPFATTEVTIIDDDDPGVLSFEKDAIYIEEGATEHSFELEVQRRNGSSGVVGCNYQTEDAVAISGVDYVGTSGELQFQDGQSSAKIPITILARGQIKTEHLFRVVLSEPFGNAKFDPRRDGGEECTICSVYIQTASEVKDSVKQIVKILHRNWDKATVGTSSWREQFSGAWYCNGSHEEQQEASKLDWFLHLASLPWKLVFALIPPTYYCGGWVCFSVCLVFIGVCTLLITELAELIGCTMGIPNGVTAITLVALGTSLPDTIASKTAAVQDPYADASIGNITGSNSVNVFLGLGLPWTIGAMYWSSSEPDPKWIAKYPFVAKRYPEGAFVVPAGGGLGFSVAIFTVCAVSCIAMLVARRGIWAGELGGPKLQQICAAMSLVITWFAYIIIATWRFMAEKKWWTQQG